MKNVSTTGARASGNAYRYMVGDGIVALCERALPEGRLGERDRLLDLVRHRYQERRSDGAKLYDGVRELLERLRERGACLGVLSNKPHELTVGTLVDLGVAQMFEVVQGQIDTLPPKPDPAGARDVIGRMGVTAAEVLYVGDTGIDMRTARAAKLTAVGVLWGFRGTEELRSQGAHHLVSRPEEILQLYTCARADE